MFFHEKTVHLGVCLSILSSLICSGLTLFDGGRRLGSIVIPQEASNPVRIAAEQLSEYLSEATGVAWPVGTEAETGLHPIYVGDSDGARSAGYSPDGLKTDGFLWKADADCLVIAGRDYTGAPMSSLIHPQRMHEVWNEDLKIDAFGEMGTFNGVCRFLEKYVGIRWYLPGEAGTVIPQIAKLEIPEMETRMAPDIEQRFAYICNFPNYPEQAMWYRHVGFGAPHPVPISHSYLDMLKYKDSHPEYFALIDGKRDFDNRSVSWGGNLCLSNPGTMDAWLEMIGEYFQEHPEAVIYPVCPNDGLERICECPDCQAQISPELGDSGKFSNYIWNFSNKLAREVGKRWPGRCVGTFAYEHYRELPNNIETFEPNLAVLVCYSRQFFNVPSEKEKIRRTLEAWKKRSPKLYVWTYPQLDYFRPWIGFPWLNPEIMQEDIRANRALGILGGFSETEQNETIPERLLEEYKQNGQSFFYPGLANLKYYLLIKLQWDADLDVQALLDEYYRLFFGPAEEPMRKFWEFAIAKTKQRTNTTKHPSEIYSDSDCQFLLQCLSDAASLVVAGSKEEKRLEMLRKECEPNIHHLLELNSKHRNLAATYIDQDIPLDLDLEHAPWNQAPSYAFCTKEGDKPLVATTLYALASQTELGLTFVCEEPDLDKIIAATDTRDTGIVWSDDCLELFFCKDDGSDGRQFIITAGGNIFDQKWDAPDDGGDASFDGNFKFRILKDYQAGQWLLQVIIPYSELGFSFEEATQMKLNFYRMRDAGHGQTFSTFIPSMVHLHRCPDYFGKLEIK